MRTVKNPIKIDRENRKIVVNKDFLRKADYFGTSESVQLEEVRKAYPNYEVIARTISKYEHKESYEGLTYKYMEEYIEERHPELKEKYEDLRFRAKCHSIRYANIKKWFLEACKDVDEEFVIKNIKKNKKDMPA